jgi:thioesterase domain-containing protein
VYAIQTLEQDAAAMASASFEQMIDFYVRLIREVQPLGPYRLAGWCVSGWIAYGVARRLEQLGQQIEMVMIIDAWAPAYWTGQTPMRRRLMLAVYHAQRFRWMKGRPRKSSQPLTGSYFRRSLQSFAVAAGKFVARLERWANPAETHQTEEEQFNNRLQATARHASTTGPLLGRALLFRSEEEPTGPLLAADMGWSELIGRPVQVEVMPGDHHQIFDLPGARMMALRARAALGLDATSSTSANPVENVHGRDPRVVG